MKTKTLVLTMGLAAALCVPHGLWAADKDAKATATETAFIKKAADGGMAEVELGKIAAEKGGSSAVKDFGNQMVKDHSEANDNLKEVAGKMGVEVPGSVSAKHAAKAKKMSAMSGAAFDKAYVAGMIEAHTMDIASFEKASKEVKNADLKGFINETVPVMKEHLEMIKKFDQAKK